VGVAQGRFIKEGVAQGSEKDTFVSTGNRKLRLHNQQFVLRILGGNLQAYLSVLEFSDTQYVEGNTVKLHRWKVEVYSCQSFFGDSASEAYEKSMEYWWRFFVVLENLFKIDLVKNKKANIKEVRNHYAWVNHELAVEYEAKKKKLAVRDDKGELRALIDNSHGLKEFETVHPQKAKTDMDGLEVFFKDLIWMAEQEKLPKLSEILKTMGVQAALGLKTSKDLNILINFLKDKL